MKGAAFKAHWHDQSPDGLRSLIVKRMPPASPGSLDGQTYTDIEAYLLQENGGKAGAAELAHRALPRLPRRRRRGAGAGAHIPRNVGATLIDNQDAAYHAAMAAREACSIRSRRSPMRCCAIPPPPIG